MNSVMLILAVDDDPDDLELLKETLLQINSSIICITARNGQQALDYLQRDAVTLPDLVILDINMPGLGGRETLTALRSIKNLKSLNVMMFSTAIRPQDVELFTKYRADYLIKPNTIEHWQDAVGEKVKPFLHH